MQTPVTLVTAQKVVVVLLLDSLIQDEVINIATLFMSTRELVHILWWFGGFLYMFDYDTPAEQTGFAGAHWSRSISVMHIP